MTPVVENCREKDIRIKAGWNKQNVGTHVRLLVEEINDNTEFNLRAIGWKDCGKERTRILVKKKPYGVDDVVRAV